ncbi:hypothetical protein Lal_00042645 [Lupinus albus]|nr:hypothetical protein Lal_00042645 [Lupinus albus]
MTRSNIDLLHPINPEIDLRQNRTLDTDSISVSEHSVSEHSVSVSEHFVSVHFVQGSDFVYSVAYSDFEQSVYSENMAQPPTPLGPCERTLSLSIQYEDVLYVLKTGLIHLLPKFHGLAGEDPHKNLKEFHIVCSTMKYHDVQEDHICLKAFPHSLEHPAKDYWGDLKRSFLGKCFPTSRTTTIRKDISGIRQQHVKLSKPGSCWMSLAWEREPRLSEKFRISPRISLEFSPERELAHLSEKRVVEAVEISSGRESLA